MSDSKQASEVGKNLCMHVAAMNPISISEKDLERDIIENEKEIIKQQLKDSGKPENILEKMMEGKIKKFYEENTLLGQKFVIDSSITVKQYIDQCEKDFNSSIIVEQFIRYEIGL